MSMLYCLECRRPTEHLNISRSAACAGVGRTTMYRWVKRRLVHTVAHPSGRTLVCTGSLLRPSTFGVPLAADERATELATPW